jgi:hypothetical protein
MLKTLALAVLPLVTGGFVLASPAHAGSGINGNVNCVQGTSVTKTVGVWIDYDDQNGIYQKGRWATIWSNGPTATFAQIAYSAPVTALTFHLHIGCGGTPQNWGTTVFVDKPPGNFGWIHATW